MTAEAHVRGLLPLLAALPLSQRIDLSAAIADAIDAAYRRGLAEGRAAPGLPRVEGRQPVRVRQAART